ncbi:MAG: hypothetical protein ACT4UQ_03100 [Gammaproteobacteria bacterium]
MRSQIFHRSNRLASRPRICAALIGFVLGLVADPLRAQPGRPPLPPPPLPPATLCALSLEQLLGTGLEGTDTIEDRDAAHQTIEQLYQRELDRLRQQVIDEEGPLAFAVFALGLKSRGEERLEELLAENCLHELLLRARESRNAEVRERAKSIWNRFFAPPGPGGVFDLPAEEELPKPGPKAMIGKAAVRVNLPPPEWIHPGATITGSVVVDSPTQTADGAQPLPGVQLSGLVLEVDEKRYPVNIDGRFVFESPQAARALEIKLQGFTEIEGRVQFESVVDFKVEMRLVESPARDRALSRAGDVSAPPVVPSRDPYVVTGVLPAGGVGLTTRAYADAVELPLLWKTPEAAAFDVSGISPGPHVLSLWEGGQPIAAGTVSVVTLEARSDRVELRPGDVANFSVQVDGFPKRLRTQAETPEKREAKGELVSETTLAYDNRTPEIGKFVGRDEHFEVTIQRELCISRQTAWSAVKSEPAKKPRPYLPMTTPWPDTAPLVVEPLTANEREGLSLRLVCLDQQKYRATSAGRFVVDVRLKLPSHATQPTLLRPIVPAPAQDEATRAATAAVGEPKPLPIVREGGKEYFVFPDGRKLERNWRGGVGEVRPDGVVVIDYGPAYGREVEYHPDGTLVVNNRSSDTVTTTAPDGTRTFLDKRKSFQTVTSPDGTIREYWITNLGRPIEKPRNAVAYEVRKDGSIIIEYNRYSGLEDKTIHPDGTVIVNKTNDTRIETRPDGTKITLDKRHRTETIESPGAPTRIFDVLQDGTKIERVPRSCFESCQDAEKESCRLACASSCGEVCTDSTGCDCWTDCRQDCETDCGSGIPPKCDRLCEGE